MMTIREMGETAAQAARKLATFGAREKNTVLSAMADALEAESQRILEANRLDVEQARKDGLSEAMIDRLTLTSERIQGIAQGVRDVMALEDPVGEGIRHTVRPNGIEISQIRVPLGVIGMIYESRPNVTVDSAVLCLKAGNAVILRGGRESLRTNCCLAEAIISGGLSAGMPDGAVQLIQDPDRTLVTELVRMNDYVDVIIPRGGKGLKKAIIENATVPVIETGAGVCHAYLDATADAEMAERIVINAKTQRPGVCNAIEALLVHRDAAPLLLPQIGEALVRAGVELRACPEAARFLPTSIAAVESDWGEEFMSLILAVRIVDSIDEAMDHIWKYGSGHSEVIVTGDYAMARRFQREVDASTVYVNASTRFTDGSEFGFGAEIGISTQKLHARGPMGLRELTTTKYLVSGDGQIR